MNSRRGFLGQIIATGSLAALSVPNAFAQIIANSARRKELTALSQAQAHFLTGLADAIIPATDTPGASDTGVVMFIDGMLENWHTEGEKALFLRGMDMCRSESGPSASRAYIAKLDAQAFSEDSASTPQNQFYRMAKELVLVGYFTSLDGMLQNLHTHGPVGSHSFEPSGPPGDPIKY